MKNINYCLAVFLFAFLTATGAQSAQEIMQEFHLLRIPVRKDGHLRSELLAQKALKDFKGNAELEDITIFIYDEALRDSDDARPKLTEEDINRQPPFRFKVTSNTGKLDDENNQALLEGDVKVVRFVENVKTGTTETERVPEAELTCKNAVYHGRQQMLKSDGEVKLVRGSDTLTGTDLTYYLNDESHKMPAKIILDRNVKMTLSQKAAERPSDKPVFPGKPKKNEPELIHVTCDGQAIFDLETNTVYFSKNVIVSRTSDEMRCNDLMVVLGRNSNHKGGNKLPEELADKEGVSKSQVAQLHASGAVRITGRDLDPETGKVKNSYVAEGQNAVYDDEIGRIVLVGENGRLPEVRYSNDLISDEKIIIDHRTGQLTAYGINRKEGIARLRTETDGLGEKRKERQDTVVIYRDRLVYDRLKGMARFSGGIRLQTVDFQLVCETLSVSAPEQIRSATGRSLGKIGGRELGLRRVTAHGRVTIQLADGRTARANQAEFDTLGQTMTLSGPPDPIIEQPGKSRVRSHRITSTRLPNPYDKNQEFNLIRGEGPGEAVFLESDEMAGGVVAAESNDTRISYDGDMTYDESRLKAVFSEKVILTTSEELVMHAGQLEVNLLEKVRAAPPPAAEKDSTLGMKIKELIASKGVKMYAAGKNSSSDQLVYDYARSTVTLVGDQVTPATLWEKGSSITAQRLIDYRKLNRIECDGPGELTLVELMNTGIVRNSARINYKGRGIYTAIPGQPASARFYRGVELKWQDINVSGDNLDVNLGRASDVSEKLRRNRALGENNQPDLLETTLERAVMTGNVKVTSVGRVASGDRAIMQKNTSPTAPSSITLQGKHGAELRDMQGILLKAPIFVLYQGGKTGDGVVQATGPGVLYITASAAEKASSTVFGRRSTSERRKNAVPGSSPLDYTLRYEGQMYYNVNQRRIVFQKNVEIEQQTLYGRSDSMTALLEVDRNSAISAGDMQGLSLLSTECVGNVFYRYYEPTPGSSIENVLRKGADTTREGSTYLVECHKGLFDVKTNKVIFYAGGGRKVRVLEQTVERGHVERRQYETVKKAVLDRITGDADIDAPRITNIPDVTGPLKFLD